VNGFDLDGLNFVEAGAYSACARKGSQVYCWGENFYGQLGVGPTVTETAIPQLVAGSYSFLTVGERHTCASDSLGGLKCWGDNTNGRLGIGSYVNQNFPVSVGLSNVVEVQAGGTHTCARTSSGEVYCWGRNVWGQVGDGTFIDRNTPVLVF